jgi:hypothetical protein
MSRIPLERWKPQEPPADFLARVDQAIDAEAAPRPLLARRGLLAGLSAAAAAAAAAVWSNVTLTRKLLRGALVARVRTELPVARGVVAVAEPGARLSFEEDTVHQHEGEVSYRTEPGATLRVTTPAGHAEGPGACCRVRVFPAADGDLQTSGPATVLAVFQGELALRHGDRAERLSPGRYALASGGAIHTDRSDRSGAIARALSLPSVPSSPASVAPPPPDAAAPPSSAAPSASARRRPPAPPAAPSASAAPIPSASPPASASARPFIVPRCICVPGESFCACPE